MDAIENCAYYFSIFTISMMTYSLIFNRDWYDIIKYHYVRYVIKKIHKNNKKRKIPEEIQSIPEKYISDGHFIYGADQIGNTLTLKISIESNSTARIYLCLRIFDAVHVLPGDSLMKYEHFNGINLKFKDLSLEILQPQKRLRIIFNGHLLNLTDDNQITHVRFNFIWSSAGIAKIHPDNTNSHLLASAMSKEQWKNGWLKLLDQECGYQQFGAIFGTVQNGGTDAILNLTSTRWRLRGTPRDLSLKRHAHLFIAGKSGILFDLNLKSIKGGRNQLNYGFAILNNGEIASIDDLEIEKFDCPPEKFTIIIKVRKTSFKCVFYIETSKIVTKQNSGDYWMDASAECDLNSEQARAIIELTTGNSNKIEIIETPAFTPLFIQSNNMAAGKQMVVNLKSDVSAQCSQLVGEKASSLALLNTLKTDKFQIPDGIVVTVETFRKQLTIATELNEAIDYLESVSCRRLNDNLENTCKFTMDLFKKIKMTDEISKCIFDALDKLRNNSKNGATKWAVRSSAIGEDSEDFSAAGQNATYLGCPDSPDAILNAVKSCWASTYTHQSVQYRRQHGLAVRSEMCVIIQKMINADVAGVLFTRNPTNADPEIVITSNYGLGESIVSGRSDPDTIVLARSWTDQVTISRKILGRKSKIMQISNDGGIEEVENSNTDQSISDDQAKFLAKFGLLIERSFGDARDIEWAFQGDELYLLQARPITTLQTWSDFELLHELDDPILTDRTFFTVANSGEVFPGAVSVLTQTTAVTNIDRAMGLKLNGGVDRKSLVTFRHHVFLDLLNTIHTSPTKKMGTVAKIMEVAVLGHPVIDENINDMALARNGDCSGYKQIKELLLLLWDAWNSKRWVEKMKSITAKCKIVIHNDDTIGEIYRNIEQYFENFTSSLACHVRISATSVFFQILVISVLLESNEDFTVDHYHDIALLLSSCENVVSANVPELLRKIVDSIRNVDEFVRIAPEKGEEWLKTNSPETHELFRQFLNDHGFRAIGEWDIQKETWACQRSNVIGMIQANCQIGNKMKNPQKKSPNIDVIRQLKSPSNAATRFILKILMKGCRKAVGLREQTKLEGVKAVNEMRQAYKILAQRMVQSGLIPDEQLIYHFTHQELGKLINENNLILIRKAMRRQRLQNEWNDLKFPLISLGMPQPVEEIVISKGGKATFRGTPVCAGTVKARACVAPTIHDIHQLLQNGDILITYSTDIGWSPYFPKLSGIITELGGLISHGAVVAREFGLPCIVGIENVTKIFRTGDIILLSGKTGTVEIISTNTNTP